MSPKARPPNFEAFWKALRTELRQLVDTSWREYRDAALKDGTAFFRRTREDLERWAGLLVRGQLTADEVAWLVNGKKDLATLAALEQAGLALAARDRFSRRITRRRRAVAAEPFAHSLSITTRTVRFGMTFAFLLAPPRPAGSIVGESPPIGVTA